METFTQPELEQYEHPIIEDEDMQFDIRTAIDSLISGEITNVNTYHNFLSQVDDQNMLIFLLSELLNNLVPILFNKKFSEHNAIINQTYLPIIKAIDASTLSKQNALILYSQLHSIPIKKRNEVDILYDLKTKTVATEKPIETALEEKLTGLVDPDTEYSVHSGKYKIVIYMHGSFTGSKETSTIDYPFHSLEFLTCEGYYLQTLNNPSIIDSICEERYDAYPFPIDNGKLTMKPYVLMKMNREKGHGIFLCEPGTKEPFEPQTTKLFDNIRDAFRIANGEEVEEIYCLFEGDGSPKQCYKIPMLRQMMAEERPHLNFDEFLKRNEDNIGYSIDITELIQNIYRELKEKRPDINPEDCTLVFGSCRGTFGEENKTRQLKLRRSTRYTQTAKGGKRRRRRTRRARRTRRTRNQIKTK